MLLALPLALKVACCVAGGCCVLRASGMAAEAKREIFPMNCKNWGVRISRKQGGAGGRTRAPGACESITCGHPGPGARYTGRTGPQLAA